MKIAHICPFYSPAIGGVKQVVEELAKRQIKQRHEVHVYTSDWDKEKRIQKKQEIISGVYVHRCKHILRIANFATIWPSVFSKILKQDFDIIHTHVFGHVHFVLSAFAAKIKKIPHIHTTHCPWTDAYRSVPGKIGVFFSYNIFSRIALKLTKKIIAITPWEINFIKKYGGKDKQIVVIPNGMDKAFFTKVKNNDFKKKNKIKNKLVLFFGRLNITKAPDKFIEIAKSILKQRKDVTFVIRGPDEGMKQKVKKMIKDEEKIILLDETRNRNEIIKMYQAADVYVLPSYREGLPLTLFEAMASGLPIVATPVNGVPYEIKQPENGFLVKYGDNENFKKRILEILDSAKLKNKISKNNLKKAKDYNWDKISKKTLKLYKTLIAENSSHKTKKTNKSYFLGVRIDNISSENITNYLEKFLNYKKFNMITPVNPEMLIIARKNTNFKKILNNSEINICDGAGISLALKLTSKPLLKYPGSSMIYDVLGFAEKNNKKIFFLGTKPELNKKARENAKKKYPKIKIFGYSPPREKRTEQKFHSDEQIKIFSYLKKFKPDILCAFFGAPFQETWFSDNKNKLQKIGIKIGISLGGTADFLSGYIKRAPMIWQKLNLEWIYRLTTERGRFRRFITRMPFFILLVMKDTIFKRKEFN